MDKIRINLYDLLLCISNAQDLVSPEVYNHQQMVAYLSYGIAVELKLEPNAAHQVFLAGLIHDIGALTSDERLEIIDNEPESINEHSYRGATLLESFEPLSNIANIIRYHHARWMDGYCEGDKGEPIPFESHIVHLADRISVAVNTGSNILMQIPDIIKDLKSQVGHKFEPTVFQALESLCHKEYIWLDMVSRHPVGALPEQLSYENLTLDIDDLIKLSHIFSQIIDFRSRFTSRHSAGVAKVAQKLAEMSGFSPFECKTILVAGYLHDLGKIAISSKILEKPDRLTKQEIKIMRTHTYYTYSLLKPIKQFAEINALASYHHERLDGNGYPFHIKGEFLSYGSRIMAVADVFTAITENRPYRSGMKDTTAIQVLKDMAETGGTDPNITKLLLDNFTDINTLRVSTQDEAAQKYEYFKNNLNELVLSN